jgi:hypothetical protein
MSGTGDEKGVLLKDVVVTTSEGKHKSGIVSGFLPTVALTANSPARNKSARFTSISPVLPSDANSKFFTDAAGKYASLLQADQNGKQRTASPSIGSVE